MVSMLLLGLLIGMQHAMEADHVAALATLATRARSVGQTVKLGAVWGMGHALTLLSFGGIVLVGQRDAGATRPGSGVRCRQHVGAAGS